MWLKHLRMETEGDAMPTLVADRVYGEPTALSKYLPLSQSPGLPAANGHTPYYSFVLALVLGPKALRERKFTT